jgi:hypothetical protein
VCLNLYLIAVGLWPTYLASELLFAFLCVCVWMGGGNTKLEDYYKDKKK